MRYKDKERGGLFMEYLGGKFKEMSQLIKEADLLDNTRENLRNQINNAFQPQFGDGDIIEVDDAERLIRGPLGNRFNRIEEVIAAFSENEDLKTKLIFIVEEIRVYYGRQLLQKDKEIAQSIMQRFGR